MTREGAIRLRIACNYFALLLNIIVLVCLGYAAFEIPQFLPTTRLMVLFFLMVTLAVLSVLGTTSKCVIDLIGLYRQEIRPPEIKASEALRAYGDALRTARDKR